MRRREGGPWIFAAAPRVRGTYGGRWGTYLPAGVGYLTASLADYADTSSVYRCGGEGDDGPQHDAVKHASKRGRVDGGRLPLMLITSRILTCPGLQEVSRSRWIGSAEGCLVVGGNWLGKASLGGVRGGWSGSGREIFLLLTSIGGGFSASTKISPMNGGHLAAHLGTSLVQVQGSPHAFGSTPGQLQPEAWGTSRNLPSGGIGTFRIV